MSCISHDIEEKYSEHYSVETSKSVPPYKYKPLDAASQTIRVLELHETEDGELTCSLKRSKIQDTEYQALSYVWGSSEKPHRINVIDEQRKAIGHLPLTSSLQNALRDLNQASDIGIKVFWIDQICINQEDEDEKSIQVGMMGDIYGDAARVITYLGPKKPNDTEAIELMMQLHKHFEPNYKKLISRGYKAFQSQKNLLPVQKMPGSVDEFHAGWTGLFDMAFGNWTQRLWMVQENLLNADTVMLRGAQVLPWLPVASMAVLFTVYLFPVHLFARLWKSSGYSHHPNDVVDPLVASMGLKLEYESSGPVDLMPLLYNVNWYQTLRCQDPRDHIYALLSVSGDVEEIVPNYHLSVRSVYVDATIKLLKSMESLAPLEYVTTLDNLSNDSFPSWSLSPQSIDEVQVESPDGNPLGEMTIQFEDDNAVLVLTGQVVDRISFVTPPVRHPSTGFFNKRGVEWVQCHYQYLSNLVQILQHAGISIQSAAGLSRTIFPNQPWDNNTATFHLWCHLGLVWRTADLYARENSMDIPPIADTALDIIAAVDSLLERQRPGYFSREDSQQAQVQLGKALLHGRCFSMTQNNQMCNANSKTEMGDVVALLHGGSVPFVLRPDKDCFKFVGDAYVQELMGVAPDGSSVEIRLR